jgi:oligopeptide transport system permease protein
MKPGASFSRSVRASAMLALTLSVAAVVGLLLPIPAQPGCCASGPSWAHVLGTDAQGRDLLRVTVTGLGTSGGLVVLATLMAVLFGTAYGTVAGSLSLRGRALAMRMVDVASATPVTLILVTLVVTVRATRDLLPSAMAPMVDSRVLLVGAVASLQWLATARVVYNRVVEVRERPFVQAARIAGVSWLTLFARHLVPHARGPLLAVGLLALPSGMAAEGFISFLGFGVERPHLSLGVLLADGARAMSFAPSSLLVPAAALVATTIALQVIGARLQEEQTVRHQRNARRA